MGVVSRNNDGAASGHAVKRGAGYDVEAQV